MSDVYRVGRVGTLKDHHAFSSRERALRVLRRRLRRTHAETFKVRRPGEHASDARGLDPTIERVTELIAGHDEGIRLVIEPDRGPSYAIRRSFDARGHAVLEAAESQIGVPYVFGAENPKGPVGGPGAGFDCSGLDDWAYTTAVDVDLPHNADAQMHDSRVHLFHDHRQVKGGDLAFFRTDAPAGHAGHVVIMLHDQTRCVNAPHTGAYVRIEPISDFGEVLAFGRVVSVNGEL